MKKYIVLMLLLQSHILDAIVTASTVKQCSIAAGFLTFLYNRKTPKEQQTIQTGSLTLLSPFRYIPDHHRWVGNAVISTALAGITYKILENYSSELLYDKARAAYRGNCLLHDFAYIAQESPDRFFSTINVHYSEQTTTCYKIYQKYIKEHIRLKKAHAYAQRVKQLESPQSKLYYDADRLLLLIEEKYKLINNVLGLLKKCPDLAREKRDIQFDSLVTSARIVAGALLTCAGIWIYPQLQQWVG